LLTRWDLHGLSQDELHRLSQDEDSDIRARVATALGSAFSHIPDKTQAWQDLHGLIQDKDRNVRARAVDALGSAFSHIPDKTQAWQDLHKLIQDEDRDVIFNAAEALGEIFSHIPDKTQACQDLYKLSQGHYTPAATEVLGKVFSQIPDKTQAWHVLQRLSRENYNSVRQAASDALGENFSDIPDKTQAWQELIKLSQDKYQNVRISAYYSLGRASIFKATESEDMDTLKRDLESAVYYFGKSVKESHLEYGTVYSPATFCHPFYRTYLAVTFQEAKEDEVQRYLKEAKAAAAIGISQSKDELIYAVENLAEALRESQKLKERPLREMTKELSVLKLYCDRAAKHMNAAEVKAPGTIKLMRKCNPLLEERIQTTISEIQKSAKEIYLSARRSGTEYEIPSSEIYKVAKALSSRDIASMQRCSTRIIKQLKTFCELLSEEEKDKVCQVIEEIEQGVDIPERLSKIELALSYLSPILRDHFKSSTEQEILGLLRNIEFTTSKLRSGSGDTKKSLLEIQSDIKDIQDAIEGNSQSIKQLGDSLNEIDEAEIERLEQMRKELLRFIGKVMNQNRSNDIKSKEILEKITLMEQLDGKDYTSIVSDIIQIGSFLNALLGFPVHLST